jgi:hypothetical protein
MSVFLDADDALAKVEDDVRRSEIRAAQMPEFESTIADARGKAATRKRDIIVEVDASGRVTDLTLGEQALQRGAQRLAHDVLAVIRAAEADVHTKTLAAVTSLLGDDDPIVEQLQAAQSPLRRAGSR